MEISRYQNQIPLISQRIVSLLNQGRRKFGHDPYRLKCLMLFLLNVLVFAVHAFSELCKLNLRVQLLED